MISIIVRRKINDCCLSGGLRRNLRSYRISLMARVQSWWLLVCLLRSRLGLDGKFTTINHRTTTMGATLSSGWVRVCCWLAHVSTCLRFGLMNVSLAARALHLYTYVNATERRCCSSSLQVPPTAATTQTHTQTHTYFYQQTGFLVGAVERAHSIVSTKKN